MKIDFQMNMWFVESRNFGMCWARWTKYIKEIESRRRRRRKKKRRISLFSQRTKSYASYIIHGDKIMNPHKDEGVYLPTENTG
jgi:hypothetical protein